MYRVGICGLSAIFLGATEVTLSDMVLSSTLRENFDKFEVLAKTRTESQEHDRSLPQEGVSTVAVSIGQVPEVHLLEYNWDDDVMPAGLQERFDTVLCSDVLYDEKFHSGMLRCLRRLSFRTCLLSYKRRHDIPEKKFFEDLTKSGLFEVRQVDCSVIPRKNISKPNMMKGLHLFAITVREEGSDNLAVSSNF